jgi:DNA-binding transcriptional regulator PaaX
MGIKKYKYYLYKPKSEIVKDILSWLMLAGAVYIAASSPYFVRNLLKEFKKWQKYPKKKITDTFYNLKRRGLIKIEQKRGQIYISLTEEGKKRAGRFQIDALKIKRPKKWDGKWRIVIFDISQLKKIHREAFRGKLKQLGFYPLQKSVWVHAFDCQAEIELLREFFGLTEKEIRLIIAEKIENDQELKKFFKLS